MFHNKRDSKGRFAPKKASSSSKTRRVIVDKSKKQVYDIVILDRSGSMSGTKADAAIEGFNQHITSLIKTQKEIGIKTFSSLYIFAQLGYGEDLHNNDGINCFRYKAIDPSRVDMLTKSIYNPQGGTPLYRSISNVIKEIKLLPEALDKNSDITITIITDGQDTDSNESFRLKAKEDIDKAKELGWTIAFLGIGKESEIELNKLNIEKSNTLIVEDSAIGIRQGITMYTNSRSNKTELYSQGISSSVGFFQTEN
jgi:uncharacterized protein with von Willebrand factor type A (vWA) domain